MSKIQEERTTPARTELCTIGRKCDLCGKQSHEYRGWGKDSYDRQDIDITYVYGSHYPEGGSGQKEAFDVCPMCWREKLVPWFQAQGAMPTTEDWDF